MIRISGEFVPVKRLMELTDKKNLTKTERRIFAQLKFVCTLSKKGNGCYDSIIAETEEYLTKEYRTNGVLTQNAVKEAEEILAPAAQEAKSYRYLCVAHAHIDMNWMWGYDETVGTTVDTFRTMLNIMKEYPDFKFSQSQASVYKIIEENDPQMLEEIKERVKEGRWEPTASTWVEPDKNLPNGESFSRHILYTKDYLSKLFDISPDSLEIDFEPDTFGHSANIPEVLTNGGVKYYYHCRGQVGDQILYRWEAPSGADVILYTEPFWYNGVIDEHVADYTTELERITGSKTLLKVYGVGDHGGGPTRRDIEQLIEMNSWPVYPEFKFSFLKDYFKAIEGRKEELPVIHGEINFLCDGCYTTQSRIKAGNRKSESLLRESEGYAALAEVRTGNPSPTVMHKEAWRKVLFNHFHDIIPGSGVTETREYASGLYQQVFGAAETARKTAFRQICDRINTAACLHTAENVSDTVAEGGGSGYGFCERGAGKERAYVLFNDEAVERTEITELTLWDYKGDMDYLCVKDSEGKEVPFQIMKRDVHYWGHYYNVILIEATVPALGYAVYTVSEREEIPVETSFFNDMRVQYPEEMVLENDLIRVELNPADASITSMIYKPTGKEMADASRHAGIFRLVEERGTKAVTDWGTGMSAWFRGTFKNIVSAQQSVELKPVCSGPLRWAVSYEAAFASSKMKVEISLDKGSSSLCYHVVCDWREFGQPESIPALDFYLPLKEHHDSYRYDNSFGIVERKAANMDLPGSSFVEAAGEEENVLLMAKTKYGYRAYDDSMALTLIRSGCDPDPTPEIGRHDIEFAVSVTDADMSNRDLIRHSSRYNHPFSAVPVAAHEGELPVADSMLTLEKGSVAVSAVKAAEEGENSLIVRVYETDGNAGEVTFRCGFLPKGAELVDITEKKTLGEAVVSENRVSFETGAYQVKTLKISW